MTRYDEETECSRSNIDFILLLLKSYLLPVSWCFTFVTLFIRFVCSSCCVFLYLRQRFYYALFGDRIFPYCEHSNSDKIKEITSAPVADYFSILWLFNTMMTRILVLCSRLAVEENSYIFCLFTWLPAKWAFIHSFIMFPSSKSSMLFQRLMTAKWNLKIEQYSN